MSRVLYRWRDGLFARTRLMGALFVVGLGVLIWPGLGFEPALFEVGQIAPRTVRASDDFTYEDEATTEARRREAVEMVPDVYDFDVQVREEARLRIARAFEFGRAAIEAGIVEEPDFPETLNRTIGAEVSAEQLRLLLEAEFAEEIQQNLADAVTSVLAREILAEKGALAALQRPIQRRDPGGGGSSIIDFTNVLSLDEAARAVDLQVLAISELDTRRRRVLAGLGAALVRPTLVHNEVETTHLRSAAEEAVDPVVVQVRRGRTIVRAGDEVTPLARQLMEARSSPSQGATVWSGLGAMSFAALLVTLLGVLLAPARESHRWRAHAFVLAGSVILLLLVATRGAGFLGRAVAAQLVSEPFSNPAVYVWAVPVASVALLMVILENQTSAVVTQALFAAALTLMTGNLTLGLFALLTGLAAVFFYMRSPDRRTQLLRLGALVGLIGAGLILALALVRGGSGGVPEVALEAATAFLGGLLVAPLVTVVLPIFELAFERTSELRLMELSRRDNPLLRQLALRAPGTYQHSVLVGLLSEAAADAVGANSSFCAAAALYHDIGKLGRASYFVENMRGNTPHDGLAPEKSADIIRRHVTEGIETARNLNLPKDIVDVIPQHHGTRLIRVFYEKAREAAEAKGDVVDEDAFRYPGPRPQTREAAIIMIADSVEAAARSVEEPTPVKFERVVDRILGSVVEDNQLVECDLTLRDMNRIRTSFLSTLAGIHHKRLTYPGFDFGRPARA